MRVDLWKVYILRLHEQGLFIHSKGIFSCKHIPRQIAVQKCRMLQAIIVSTRQPLDVVFQRT